MSDDVDWLHDLFGPVGPITIRRMFGGAGVYRDGVMFGLVSDREIFLKCDEVTSTQFRDAGCRPFVFEKGGKPVETSYWSMPDEALDDGELLRRWAELAYQAALRTKKPARKARPKP